MPQVKLIILGQFEDKLDPVSQATRDLIDQHPGIIHIEWNEHVEYFMNVANLMVHASHREGFPNTLLQAGAMNCPIVCSAIEGNIDIVSDHETGLLFQAKNEGELLKQLKYALERPEQMKQYAVNLRKKVETNFSQPFVHAALRDKYLSLLHKAS